ncbi:DUF6624 domain-containing protein [Pontibacter pamirensis]|uniref:DUF6624 domain-containing protein n=1 Tax=Pontibacter pamirensis TaxID=2562824 RepID=UPI001389E070|nr:DUF6624 domain-containing protein [Pontibacter pamirensis]
MKKNLSILILILLISSCTATEKEEKLSEIEKWKLGWRMIVSSTDENYQLGELQFDSLLSESSEIEPKFLITGLEILDKLGKREKLVQVINGQDQETLQVLCNTNLFTQNLNDVDVCKSIEKEKVSNPKLQMELVKMYVDDQAVRGNLQEDIITKYSLIKAEIANEGEGVDDRNRERLKEIFREHGFPTKEMVGKDAMSGIFIMIQHADYDKEWQKSQLPNIEQAVQNGDMDGQSYAYLYDRIKSNAGEKQRYGTQFSHIDPANKTVELAPTEDMENLDKRRMEAGMMPIEMYKEIMLENLSN